MKDPGEQVRHIVEHAAHFLPAQGPIGVFIHHNTLHAFQDRHFEKAVTEAANLFDAEPYLSEDRFRQEFQRGRIQIEDIDFVVSRQPNEAIIPGKVDRQSLLRTLLTSDILRWDEQTIRWEMEDGSLSQIFSSAAGSKDLFRACHERLDVADISSIKPVLRPRDGFIEVLGKDLDDIVHPVLIRFCAAYLDQGLAYWPMPNRELGFLKSVQQLWSINGNIDPEKLEGLGQLLRHQMSSRVDAVGVILETLEYFEVPEDQWESVITAELIALPGWAGMFRRLENDPQLAAHFPVPCTLMDFLAVRLTLTRVAADAANVTGIKVAELWKISSGVSVDGGARRLTEAATLFDAVRQCGITVHELEKLSSNEFEKLRREILSANSNERRRLFHLAYEHWHERSILDPISVFSAVRKQPDDFKRPDAQVMFCLDEREESIRRHLEEVDPAVETFGAAGFFGVAVNYTGIDDGTGAPLCPVVVKPQHAVRELPVDDHQDLHLSRKNRRKVLGRVSRGMSVSSRTLVRGWLSTIWLGLWTLFPLAARVLAPRRYAQLRDLLNRAFLPEPRTELTLMRTDEEGLKTAEGLLLGFSINEKVDRVASVLLPAGMRSNFARLVVILGHGSTSLNNPYESAYDCGACGGRGGGPNARLFAAMANRPEVRQKLQERGVHIPDDTWFLGGFHDTCNDDIDLLDVDHVPASHQEAVARIRRSFDQARAWNAHERSRRFEAANPKDGPDMALHHVQERSEHLAEPRPELGHCTNSVTYIGRRSTVRGLFFDRRAFLTSYDPQFDPDDTNLTALMSAALPVCGGINLEYYFSSVDNVRFGSGTKLPHNVTSLIGVMNGNSSDLLTGLPSQMIEIHEPVRSLFVIETTPARLMNALSRLPHMDNFVTNHWIRVATLDPESGEIHVYRGNSFEPREKSTASIPTVARSSNWYQGRMDHLPVAVIEKGMVTA